MDYGSTPKFSNPRVNDQPQTMPARDYGEHMSSYLPRRRPLADEFWFLSHRDYGTGRLLADGILGTALAGALIGELALAGYVRLQAGRVVPIDPAAEPAEPAVTGYPRHAANARRIPPPRQVGIDPLHGIVMTEITARGALYPVTDWITFLVKDVAQHVTGRMEAAGLLRPVGGVLRRRKWEPVDASTASSPGVALRYQARALVTAGAPVDQQTALLAGLTLATGLVRQVDVDDMSNLRDALLEVVNTLPDDALTVLRAVQDSVTAQARQVRR
ncbi:GPP34 family phosphoprotein [Dactylosporangium sp. NPDC051484]|uniref:GOLPH3/VPS74 family protein n=1 Tax=Dactylosporangium sp. NPDC051484 TaxID=3154942 RepID=UPI00344D2C43